MINDNPFSKVYDCPNTVDCLDCTLYPESNPDLGEYMYEAAMEEPGKDKAFPLVCFYGDVHYIALYLFIWNKDKVFVERFIIRPGYRMSMDDEQRFYGYCDTDLHVDPHLYESFSSALREVLPAMDDEYSPDQTGLLMCHMYWCSLLNDVTPSQWQYAQCILSEDGIAPAEYFSKDIYEYLIIRGNRDICEQYRKLRKLRSGLIKESGIRISTPLPAELGTVIARLDTALKYYNDSFRWAEENINKRNEVECLCYGSGEFIVLQPTIKEVIEDAFMQHPGLISCLDDYVNGYCRILLLRRYSCMNEPFTALIVCDTGSNKRSIIHVYGPCEIFPDVSVFRWLELYSRAMALEYRPDEMIEGLEECLDGSEGYTDQHISALREYAEQYRLEHGNKEE